MRDIVAVTALGHWSWSTEKDILVLRLLYDFVSRVQGMMPPTFRVDLPPSVNQLWKYLHKHGHVYVFSMTLNLVKFIMKTNHMVIYLSNILFHHQFYVLVSVFISVTKDQTRAI